MDCLFCKIINKQIPSECIYNTNECVVIKDIHPQAPVHLLVIPKTHVNEFVNMPTMILTSVFELAKQIITEHQITAYRLVNNGKDAAVIDHFHLHILGKIDKKRSL